MAWISAPRVCKSFSCHAAAAVAKRCLDGRAASWDATVELTSPEGSSKGHEQLGSFHAVGGSLEVKEERVAANVVGKLAPFGPTVAGWVVVSLCPRSSEMAAETIAGATWAGVQEPSCEGRGNW